MHYDWPGNVRQLENLIKRMVILGSEAQILGELHQSAAQFSFRSPSSSVPRPVAAPLRPVPPPAVAAAAMPGPVVAAPAGGAVGSEAAKVEAVAAAAAAAASGNVSLKDIARTAAREAERELILRMLTRTRWNRKEAAEILGISYKALLYKIKESGLDKAS
jgi:DNA-binding NtrC family response regulator